MKMKNSILVSSILLLSLSAQAQSPADTTSAINRTVLVESVYNPVLASSEKRSFLPEEPQPSTTRQPVTYADEVQSDVRLTRNPLATPALALTQDPFMPGYLRLGYGNYNHLDGMGLYRFQAGKRDAIDLSAVLTGWNGSLPCEGLGLLADGSERWKGYRNDLDVHAGWQHEGKTNVVTDVDFGRYGRSFIVTNPALVSDQTSLWYGASVALAGALADLGLHTKAGYGIRTGFHQWHNSSWFGFSMPNVENHVSLGLDYGYRFDRYGRIEVSMDNDWLAYRNLTSFDTYYSLRLQPRWVYGGRGWTSSVGFNMDVQNTVSRSFQMSPECHFTLTPSDFIRIDLVVDGGRDLQTFRDLYALTPWWTSDGQLRKAYTYVNAHLHADARVTEGLHLGVHGGWRSMADAVFATDGVANGMKSARLVNADATVWTAGGHLTYALKDIFNAGADVTYNGWGKVEETLLAYAPQLEAKANVRARIIEGLHAQADFRYCMRHEVMGVRKPAVADLGLTVDYAVGQHLSVYATGANLLNRTYSLYPIYPAEGIRGLAGVVLKF